MKKETIIWQIIFTLMCVFFISTLQTYFDNKNKIEAKTNKANCLINVYQNETLVQISDLKIICDNIIDSH